MGKKYLVLLLLIASTTSIFAQIPLYTNNFSGGASGWALDNDQILDGWIVNNSYNCSPTTPDRNGGNYLHIYNDLMTDLCALGYYGGGSSTTVNADMTTNINTTGYDTVTLSFWWLCKGTSQSYGSVWYSTNGGSSWQQFTTRSKYISQNTWAQETITIHASNYSDALNKSNLRLRFQWKNGGIGANPAFSVDDILVTGNGNGSCTNAVGSSMAIRPSICSGQVDSIYLNSYSGNLQWQQSPNGTDQWVNVTGGSGDTSNPYITPALTTSTHYRAVVSQASCTDKYSSVSAVIVNSIVTPVVAITMSPAGPACAGDTLFFTPVVGNGGTAPTYRWVVNNIDVSTAPAYFSNTLSNGSEVSCVITSNAACATTTQAVSNTLTVFTVSNLTPTISIQANVNGVCNGVAVNLTSTVTNQGFTPAYQWKINGLDYENGSSFSSTFLSDKDTITCVLTSNETCSNPKTVTSQPVIMTIYSKPDKTITVTGTTTFCEGDSVVLKAADNLTYLWSNGATTQSIIVKSADTYSVSLSNTHCDNASSAITTTINPLPAIPVLTQAQDTFTSTAATTYQWYLDDTLIAGATAQTYKVAKSGYYAVEITDGNGCPRMSAKTYYLITGIDKPDNYNIAVYPNPSSGNWQLSVDKELTGKTMEITDANGRLVFQSEIRSLRSEIAFTGSAGIYFLRIATDRGVINHKLIRL